MHPDNRAIQAMLLNDRQRYGRISRYLHWVIAACIFLLALSGWYTVELGYMAPAYQRLLDWHQLIGLLVLALAVAMISWHLLSRPPTFLSTLNALEKIGARLVHTTLYASIIAIPITGYLAATEDGPVTLFGLTLPMLYKAPDSLALSLHLYFGYAVVGVALLHALAALKHHFINKDSTLRRMLTGAA